MLRGRVVLIHFWATWCAPCQRESAHLQALRESAGPRGLELLGVSVDALDRRSLRSWLAVRRISWPQIHDGLGFQGRLARDFGVRCVPSTLLVNRDGLVVARDIRGERLEALVFVLLDQAATDRIGVGGPRSEGLSSSPATRSHLGGAMLAAPRASRSLRRSPGPRSPRGSARDGRQLLLLQKRMQVRVAARGSGTDPLGLWVETEGSPSIVGQLTIRLRDALGRPRPGSEGDSR